MDFYQRFWKKQGAEKELIRFGQMSSGLVLLIGVLWSPIVGRWESIFAYFQECWFFMAVPIVVVFVSALLWPRANNFSATATLLLCVPLTMLPVLIHQLKIEINSYNIAGLLLIPVTGLHILMAYLTPAPDRQKIDRWVWKPSMVWLESPQAAQRWYRNLLLWWIVLLVIFVGIYAWFW
jgi:SSS family solute:Na+ symporter